MKAQALFARLMLAILSLSAHAESPVPCKAARQGADQVRLSWDCVPGKGYQLKTTTDLSLPWQVLATQPASLMATTNSLEHLVPIESGVRFFRVVKLDTEPPQVIGLWPINGAIAVGRSAPLQAKFQDETGVDPASLVLTLGTRSPVTLADPRLTFTNNVLTYTPTNGETLGNYADQVAATISVADTLGNTLTNFPWTFSLELQTVPSDGILFVTNSGLQLISTNGNFFTYSFTGTNSGLTNGLYLVDPDLRHGYTRTVMAFVEDPTNHIVTVTTKPTALARLLQTGSFSSEAVLTNLTETPQPKDWRVGAGIELKRTVPLAIKFYDQDGILIELTEDSRLALDLRAGVSANFSGARLTEIQAGVSGSVDFEAVFHALVEHAEHWEDEVPLIEPIHQFYGGFIGLVPVWVEAVWEFNLGCEADLEAKAELTAGCQAHKEMRIGRCWDGAWHDISQYPPATFHLIGPTWQIEGSASVRAYVQPKLTLYVESIAGVSASLEPYVELGGSVQLNPPQCEWGVYAGLSATLALDVRGWDDAWGDLPSWSFDLIPRTTLYHQDCTTTTGNARIIVPPSDLTVAPGDTAFFTVDAEGADPLQFQWQHNGVNLADGPRVTGSQNSVLCLAGVVAEDAGAYRVLVSNPGGSAVSDPATLTVQVGGGPSPSARVLIPAGSFQMGNCSGDPTEPCVDCYSLLPVHTVYVSAFYMDQYLVTKALWDEVYYWASTNGYRIDNRGAAKQSYLPVDLVAWYDLLKWCNARSEKEGRVPAYYITPEHTNVFRTGKFGGFLGLSSDLVNWNAGYRLPTEAEWEKAARGGLRGKRFPWGDTISHSQANYYSYASYSYDVSPTRGYNPAFVGVLPYTSPVNYFPPNGYGLYDMAGNLWECCWDLMGPYPSGSVVDPHGAAPGGTWYRALRGGNWEYTADFCRVADREGWYPDAIDTEVGFRCVLPAGHP